MLKIECVFRSLAWKTRREIMGRREVEISG